MTKNNNDNMKNIRIYKTYAKTFFDHAKAESVLPNILEDFHTLLALFTKSKKLERFFSSTICSFEAKVKLLKLCQFHQTSVDFLHVLFKNNQASYLQEIYNEMLTLKISDDKMTRATLISASEMDASDIATCKEMLEKKLKEKFAIEHKIDSNIIGGIILKFGTMMYDASVKTALQKLKEVRI